MRGGMETVLVQIHGARMPDEQGEGEGKGCIKTRNLWFVRLTQPARKVAGAWPVPTLNLACGKSRRSSPLQRVRMDDAEA